MSGLSALFIGGRSLLQHCAEHWLAAGHSIAGVILTSDETLSGSLSSDQWKNGHWTELRSIPHYSNKILVSNSDRGGSDFSEADVEVKDADKVDKKEGGLAELPRVDYIFSIVNLTVTPTALLQKADKLAINFHDGPLPHYAGLNVTNWALINGESEHGICWHVMTPHLDCGDLLLQQRFPIASDETALTLNAKCFQAGLSSFATLVEQIASDSLMATPQPVREAGHFFYRARQKPWACGFLNWRAPAASLSSLVRALDFGRYLNPIALPKFVINDRLYLCRTVAVDQTPVQSDPLSDPLSDSLADRQSLDLVRRDIGAVVEVSERSVMVLAADGAVRLSEITHAWGGPIENIAAKINSGESCQLLLHETAVYIQAAAEQLAPYEAFWRLRLPTLTRVSLPFRKLQTQQVNYMERGTYGSDGGGRELGSKCCSLQRIEHRVDVREAHQIVALFALFIGRLSGVSSFSLPILTSASSEKDYLVRSEIGDALADQLFARVTPFALEFTSETTLQEIFDSSVALLEQTLHARTFALDLLQRTPEVSSTAIEWFSQQQDIALQIGGSDAEAKACRSDLAALVVRFDPACPLTLQWFYDEEYYADTAIERLQALFAHFYVCCDDALKSVASVASAVSDDRVVGDIKLVDISLLPEQDSEQINDWNRAQPIDTPLANLPTSPTLVAYFEQRVKQCPDECALIFRAMRLSYSGLNRSANKMARLMAARGIGSDDRVGILLHRSEKMVVAMLAALKVGAAYVPLDPSYPAERLRFMVSDADLKAVVVEGNRLNILPPDSASSVIDLAAESWSAFSDENLDLQIASTQLAYMIYTSGSTGQPKAVMVEHGHVVSFFAAMDPWLRSESEKESEKESKKEVGCERGSEKAWEQKREQKREQNIGGLWLAVTSISFDISVLELFWSLTRGLTVLLYRDPLKSVQRSGSAPVVGTTPATVPQSASTRRHAIKFGLFFWNHIDPDNLSEVDRETAGGKYDLLFQAAEWADREGFDAIWTPERHFGAFGGDYPNPSVISAALAARTSNIDIRAGSCVLPLHHPARVVEEWAVVDHISKGRVGISFAAGWQPNDFVLQPENHANAKQVMLDNIETVQALWRGEAVEFPGPNGPVTIETQPKPLQPTLPGWLTTAGNAETFRLAGERGLNLLTHLLGQSIERVADNIKIYREAWRLAGHTGRGQVTLMLHTLVGKRGAEQSEREREEEEQRIEDLARAPMKSYLKSAMFLVKQAAWHFPTFSKLSEESGASIEEQFEAMDEQTLDDLLEFAFLRYYRESGLFGSFSRCQQRIEGLKAINVDEIGALIDFGLEDEVVFEHLPNLAELMHEEPTIEVTSGAALDEALDPSLGPSLGPSLDAGLDLSIAELAQRHTITHLQCTPSQASLLMADGASKTVFKSLQTLLVGGEALPLTLAQSLRSAVPGALFNVYGPTETTIWSSLYRFPNRIQKSQETADNQAFEKVFIGRPLANTQCHVVDEYMRPVPIGVAGELLIGGQSVTRGYHRQQSLTEQRFISFCHSTSHNDSSEQSAGATAQRCYRTGDIVRWSKGGELEYLGRVDFQVKIRGFRIELGEIEALLEQQEGVRQAVVIVRTVAGFQQLVGFLVVDRDEPTEEACQSGHRALLQRIRRALARQLPDVMVPALLHCIDQMPVTPNGKIDRKALVLQSGADNTQDNHNSRSEPASNSVSPGAHESSTSSGAMLNRFDAANGREMLGTVQEVWQMALGHEVTNLNANFFEVGGHSLLALKVLADLRQATGAALQITDLFRFTTIKSLAEYIVSQTASTMQANNSRSPSSDSVPKATSQYSNRASVHSSSRSDGASTTRRGQDRAALRREARAKRRRRDR